MATSMDHAYALLIGVDANATARLALPAVAKDIERLHDVLVHPDRAGYPPQNVTRVTGRGATRDAILRSLDWLSGQVRADADENTTAFVYYSGHGHMENGRHHLVPYDVDPADVEGSTLPAADFADALQGMRPRRLLVALDCCHAAAVGAKGDADLDLSPAALTPDSDALAPLTARAGRAVLSSSRGTEVSWIRKDESMSVFTYHLIEALNGHATGPNEPTVLVSDAISHVARRVTETVRAERNAEQVPVFHFEGEAFPVALVLGGKGAAKGELPDPAEKLTPKVRSRAIVDVVEGKLVVTDVTNVTGGAELTSELKAKRLAKDSDTTVTRIENLGG